MKTKHGYEQVAEILQNALDQAQHGKGNERHANDLPFEEQRMLSISRGLDSDVGIAYQIQKKVQECRSFDNLDAIERELFGAIIYAAGMVIFHREKFSKKKPSSSSESGHFAVQIPETSSEKFNREMIVDVSNLSVDQKESVLFLLARLGFRENSQWRSDYLRAKASLYAHQNGIIYTSSRKPTHTFHQLLELAGVGK